MTPSQAGCRRRSCRCCKSQVWKEVVLNRNGALVQAPFLFYLYREIVMFRPYLDDKIKKFAISGDEMRVAARFTMTVI